MTDMIKKKKKKEAPEKRERPQRFSLLGLFFNIFVTYMEPHIPQEPHTGSRMLTRSLRRRDWTPIRDSRDGVVPACFQVLLFLFLFSFSANVCAVVVRSSDRPFFVLFLFLL